jgi:hypothetical protein
MAPKKTPQLGPKGSPLWKGLVKRTVSLTPDQDAALNREALRRALDAGEARPDAGAIMREALDAWLAKNAKR